MVRVRDVLLIAGDPSVDQGDHADLALLPRPHTYEMVHPDPIDLGRELTLPGWSSVKQKWCSRLLAARSLLRAGEAIRPDV